MRCPKLKELLGVSDTEGLEAFVHLSPGKRGWVTRHIKNCEICQQEHKETLDKLEQILKDFWELARKGE